MTVKAFRGLATVYLNIKDVVVGDIIELNEGDFVPADCVLIESS
jgi:magnesium-transporting ATPase (P-type)